MRTTDEAKRLIIAVSIMAWMMLVVLGGAVWIDNVMLRADLNALKTACKANLLVEKSK
jgi:hypothetical protein